MNTFAERVALIVTKKCNGNRSEFARTVGITPAYAAQIYKGDRVPSDRTISDICREFSVNRIWLETGAGEPFQEKTRDEQIAEVLGRALANGGTARDRIIRAIAQLPDELFPYAERILDEMIQNMSAEK